MVWPAGLPLGSVTFGGAVVTQNGSPLAMRVTIDVLLAPDAPSTSLVYKPTGTPLVGVTTVFASDDTPPHTIPLPLCDSPDVGYGDGTVLVLDAGHEFTHVYRATIDYLSPDLKTTYRRFRTVKVFAITSEAPSGNVDDFVIIPSGSDHFGIPVAVPDIWSEQVAEAVAAAGSADAAAASATAAGQSATSAASSASSAAGSAATATTGASTATSAATSATASAQAAALSEESAGDDAASANAASTSAASSAGSALASKNAAQSAATTAVDSATSANEDATTASQSSADASVSEQAAAQSALDSDAARVLAVSAKNAADASRDAAATSAGDAAASATEARNGELGALAAQAAAQASQAAALASAGVATTKAGEASTSAADADADRVAAQTALAGAVAAQVAAEAAKNAIPSMPVIATNGIFNPSFTSDLTFWNGWSMVGGVIAQSRPTTGGVSGAAFYRGTVTTAGTGVPYVSSTVAGGLIAAPGDRVSGALWVRSAIAARFAINLDFFTSAGAVARGSTQSALVSIPANMWTRIILENQLVPDLADRVRISLGSASGDAALFVVGTTIDIDAAIVTRGATVPEYFDGSTPGARWTGAANASASELVVARPSDFVTPSSLPVLTRNLALQPVPVNTNNDSAVSPASWRTSRWFGSGGVGTQAVVVASDGPAGLGVPSYLRKTWTTAPTNNGDTGFDNTGATQFAVTPGETILASSYLRSSRSVTGSFRIQSTPGTDISSSPIPGMAASVTLVVGEWTRIARLITVPAGVTSLKLISDVIGGSAWQVGDTLDGTALQIERGVSVPSPFVYGYSPGGRWTGTPNVSASELTFYRPSEVAVAARSALRYSEGVGSPEGLLIANPGAEYLDTAGTNGAWLWRKRTGTSSTGWVVVDGDTGWREVSSLLINGWVANSVRICRIGKRVDIIVSSPNGTAATADAMLNLVSGFRTGTGYAVSPRFPYVNGVNAVDNTRSVAPDISANTLRALGATYTGINGGSMNISYTTFDVAWPATLPGTAV